MLRFLRIERPTTQTLRPTSTATSIACCMRWMFDANERDEDAARALRDDLPERLADDALGACEARALGVRRVAEHAGRRRGCRARRACRRRSAAVDRRVVELPVARVEDRGRPASRARSPTASGTECAMRTNSSRNGPSSTGSPSGSISRSSVERSRPCSSSFDWTRPSVSRVASTSRDRAPRGAGTAARRRGPRGACVSTTRGPPRARAGTRSPAGRGRRRDARRAGTRARRRRRRCSPSALEHGHVLADLAEAAERDDPRRSSRRCMARSDRDRAQEPDALEARADLGRLRRSLALDERQPRHRRRRRPSRLSAALIGDRVRRRPSGSRVRARARASISAAPSRSPGGSGRMHLLHLGPTTCVCTQMPPIAPSPRNGRMRLSSPA